MVKVFKPKSYRKRKRPSDFTWKQKKLQSDEVRGTGRLTMVRNPDYGFPDKMRTRLRYCDTIALNGGSVNYAFMINSCYDPDFSGIGHRPAWFTTICGAVGTAPYSRYRVLGSKIKVTFTQYSAPSLVGANYAPTLVYIDGSNQSSLSYGSAAGVMENSGAKHAVLQDKSGGNNVKTLTLTYSPQRDLGLSAGDDTISGVYNGSPSARYYAHFGKIDQGANASIVQAYVELEYYVEFYQRNEAPVE